MRRIGILLILVSFALVLSAEIGWSGNIWPNSGTFHVPTEDMTVYYQIWKDGVTPGDGQGTDLSAMFYYRLSGESEWDSVEMPYLGEVGNNDEYSVMLSAGTFTTGDVVEFYCEGHDASDDTYSYGTDQNDAGPFTADAPGTYSIGSPLQQDVTVTFQVDLSLVGVEGDVSVAGSFNGWTAGQNLLTDQGDNIYAGDVLFAEGTTPMIEYKFVNGGTWEGAIANRVLEIDDTNPTMVLDVVYFNDDDPANYTTQDVTVTFNCDVADSVNAGAVFTTLSICGSVAPLDWDFAANTNQLADQGDNVWSVDILFPAGSWRNVEYKFARNGMDVEAPAFTNHTMTIDDSGATQVIDVTYGDIGNDAHDGTVPEFQSVNLRNYPNPFNPETTIMFSLAKEQPVELAIYNLKGQKVRTLYRDIAPQGETRVTWHGTDENDKAVSSGVYLMKLKGGRITASGKVILIK